MPERPGIYLILNFCSDKGYVGSSVDAVRRLYLHRRMLRRGQHHSPQLQRAFDRDGEAAFSFAVIERCAAADLLRREQFWIDYRQSSDPEFGYNVCAVTGTRRGVPQPPSVAEKMRAVHAGKPKSPETKAKMSAAARGRKNTREQNARISEAVKRAMADPGRRALQSKNQIGKPAGFKGRRHAPETIAILRAKALARAAARNEPDGPLKR